jgi:hypothetical protein
MQVGGLAQQQADSNSSSRGSCSSSGKLCGQWSGVVMALNSSAVVSCEYRWQSSAAVLQVLLEDEEGTQGQAGYLRCVLQFCVLF